MSDNYYKLDFTGEKINDLLAQLNNNVIIKKIFVSHTTTLKEIYDQVGSNTYFLIVPIDLAIQIFGKNTIYLGYLFNPTGNIYSFSVSTIDDFLYRQTASANTLDINIRSLTFTKTYYTIDRTQFTSNNDIVNKKYVDDNKSSKVLLGSAVANYLSNDALDRLGLTITFSNLDFTDYDLLLLTGLNSSCFILVTQVLTNLLSVMNLPYNNEGESTICRVRASQVNSNFTINITSPNANMFNFTNLPTFYLYGIKL